MKISVIIPCLNEGARIAQLLSELVQRHDFFEIIVVDGGSHDDTVKLARSEKSVRIVAAPKGRARQSNAGAQAANGDVLLFLHADTRLPAGAAGCIRRALRNPATVAGAFQIHTVPEPKGRQLGPLLRLADLRSRYSRLPYGDQALFVRKKTFQQVGAYPDQPLMEDLELSRRIRRVGQLEIVKQQVQVSGRRFQARPLYYFVAVNTFPLLYRLGVPPSTLARAYGNPR